MKKWLRIISGLLSVTMMLECAPLSGLALAEEKRPVVLEDIKATQAFVMDYGYVGDGQVIDLNNDGCVDVFDVALAKQELIKTGLPSLTNFRSDVFDIYINKETPVTFTVNVTEVAVLPAEAVKLCNEEGKQLAVMHDDGKNGDEVSGDGIYSAVVTLNEEDFRLVQFHAEAEGVRSNTHTISFYRDMTDEEIDYFGKLLTKINQLSFKDACAFVKSSDEVESFEVDEEQQIVIYDSVYHISGMWIPPERRTDDGEEGAEHTQSAQQLTLSSETNAAAMSSNVQTAAGSTDSSKKDVAVLCPYYDENNDANYAESIANTVASKVGSAKVDVYKNRDVTLKQMKNLSGYGTVIISTKNFTPPSGLHTYMLLGKESRFHVNWEDINAKRIFWTDFSGFLECRFMVAEGFFEKYYGNNSLNGSFWFLNCPNTITKTKNNNPPYYDKSFADRLMDSGAQGVFGFNETYADASATNPVMKKVFDSLMQKNTLRQAYNSLTQAEKKATDIRQKQTFQYFRAASSNGISSQGQAFITIGIVRGKPGDTVELPINISYDGPYNLGGFVMQIDCGSYAFDFDLSSVEGRPAVFSVNPTYKIINGAFDITSTEHYKECELTIPVTIPTDINPGAYPIKCINGAVGTDIAQSEDELIAPRIVNGSIIVE